MADDIVPKSREGRNLQPLMSKDRPGVGLWYESPGRSRGFSIEAETISWLHIFPLAYSHIPVLV